MASSKALLDTTILSAIMKGETNVTARARAYLAEHPALTFSIITRYEILRGLKAKGANTQLAAFDQLCANSEVLLLTDEIIVRAAEVYATLRARGELIGDADILIGATALVNGVALVTDNEQHFRRVPGLRIANWLRD